MVRIVQRADKPGVDRAQCSLLVQDVLVGLLADDGVDQRLGIHAASASTVQYWTGLVEF